MHYQTKKVGARKLKGKVHAKTKIWRIYNRAIRQKQYEVLYK